MHDEIRCISRASWLAKEGSFLLQNWHEGTTDYLIAVASYESLAVTLFRAVFLPEYSMPIDANAYCMLPASISEKALFKSSY